MVEMTEAATMLHRNINVAESRADRRNRTRNIDFDGLACAWAIAHELREEPKPPFSHHYFRLTALPSEIDGCANLL
jgi:hypothetical protein